MSSQIESRGKGKNPKSPVSALCALFVSVAYHRQQAPKSHQKPPTALELPVFLVSIEHIQPDWSVQAPRSDTHGYFWPPTVPLAYHRNPPGLFRWKDGNLTPMTTNDPGWQPNLVCHSRATVFSQQDKTDHLLAVELDATTVPIPHDNHRWDTLHFEHIAVPGQSQAAKPPYYSKINMQGIEGKIAAPASNRIVNQILPHCYNYVRELHGHVEIEATKSSAGLIGSLPILISLAAFSAPLDLLRQTLQNHVRRNTWISHTHPLGRKKNVSLT